MPTRKKPTTLAPDAPSAALVAARPAAAPEATPTPEAAAPPEAGSVPPLARTARPRRAKPAPAAAPVPPTAPALADAPPLPPFLAHRVPPAAPPAGRSAFIYALTYTNGLVFYVGKAEDPQARLREHLRAARRGTHSACNAEIRRLLAAGQTPGVRLLEEVPEGEAWKRIEDGHIARLWALGNPLTNEDVPLEVVQSPRPVRHPEEEVAYDALPAALPPADGVVAALAEELVAAAPTRRAAPAPAPAPVAGALQRTRWTVPLAWLLSLVAFVIGVGLLGTALVGLGVLPGAPGPSLPPRTDKAGSAPPAPATAPPDLPVGQGAVIPQPPAPYLGSHTVQVQPNQTLADVAAQLDMTPDSLAAQLGRSEVYAGEEITHARTADDLAQGGGATPTVDVYNGKGVDAPVAPTVEMTVLASDGLCPPGTARAGLPRDGRVIPPFVPGCAPEDSGAIGPEQQAWVPGPPTPDAQGGGPPDILPATGMAGVLPQAAALVATLAEGVAAADPAPPVEVCADGSVKDRVHRTKAPFVPGCAPLPIGPVQP